MGKGKDCGGNRLKLRVCFGRLCSLKIRGKGAHIFLTHRQPQSVLGSGQRKAEPLGVVAHSLQEGRQCFTRTPHPERMLSLPSRKGAQVPLPPHPFLHNSLSCLSVAAGTSHQGPGE